MSMSHLLGWGGIGGGAYVRDKNTSARFCAEKAGGGGGAYLQDTMVYLIRL